MNPVATVLRALGGGGLPRTYWVLWVGTFVNRLGSFVAPFLALYLTRERGFSVEQTGFIVALNGAGTVLAAPLGGMLADRVGRRLTLAGGLWLGSGAMLFIGFSETPGRIAVAAFFLGILGDLYRPAVSAAVADLVPPKDRARAYGMLYWVINLGFAIALPLAGLLAGLGYRLLFVADAATTFVYGCCVWAFVPETRPQVARDSLAARSTLGDLLTPFRDGVYLSFCLPVFALALLFFQSTMSLPVTLSARGLSPADYGLVMAVNGVLIVALQPFVTRVVGRMRRSTALALAGVLTGVGFGLHALPAGVPWAMTAVAVWTLGEMAQSPVAPSVVADLAPPELRGSYQGAYHMMWGLASSVAPALGGAMLGHAGANALWAVCFGVGMTAAAWHLAIAGARRRRVEVLRTERPEMSTSMD
ncbi:MULTISPECIES: MFS transporter [Corallococcus]|uniref:MDR family MFS transporter n=1 Tax=Corallococcus TaxID=83461 RepID=UPI00117FAD40|nr:MULTISPECIES: MFS transporter [Corallococcus]NBD13724.1 MFS transporter [Corallococcus silvisoli]TSC22817.1 MFS transporter [Corallococcus sp. Z5C101001]